MFCLSDELIRGQLMKSGNPKNWHVGKSPKEIGDYQGMGIRQKEGKQVSSYFDGKTNNSKETIGKKIKQLA